MENNIKGILNNYPDVLTVEEVGKVLTICNKTTYKLIKEGNIKSLKIGRTYRVPKVYLVEYILKCA